ncbi:MAG: sigma-70 family RNA polymerase sigma factor [Leptospiraceae bacterium]|nr:sigma-70 family RNA polymerase sigma factor [Leptospiraceae bacterium]
MWEKLSDEELLRELKRAELAEYLDVGAKQAEQIFSVLVSRHQTAFIRLVALRYPVDSATAEEIVQDFWLECYTALARYDTNRPFLPWATTILFRTAERFLRRRRHEVQLSPQSELFQQQKVPDTAGGGDEEELRKLIAAVRQLPKELALLIELRFFQEKKIDEICALTGLGRSTVFEKLNLAFRKLRRLLGEKD